MLCSDCSKLLSPAHRLDGTGAFSRSHQARYWRSIIELRDNSTQCKICATLLKKLPADASSPANLVPLSAFRRAGLRIGEIASGAVSYDTKLFCNKHDESGQTARLDVQLVSVGSRIVSKSLMPTGANHITSSFLVAPESLAAPLCTNSTSVQGDDQDAHFSHIKQWLRACISTHNTCSRAGRQPANLDSGQQFLPTRVIEILKIDIKLSNTSTSGQSVSYATLSHRWPTRASALMQLTTSNIHSLYHGIDQDDATFSQVFRDAITVCRQLEIQYLWIDSLCIIQDGDAGQDWLREAARMGQVYKNAILNIAATSVLDGDEAIRSGFLRPRNDRFIAPSALTHKTDCITGVNRETTYHLVPLDDFNDEIDQAVLNRRGWVMQERHLSLRILHFGANQVWWECNERICSDAYPQGHPAFVFRKPPRSEDFLATLSGLPRSLPGTPALLRASRLWHLLVEVYSRGSLTYGKDKLVAFSGIAREFQTHFQLAEDEYAAGCWKQYFPDCLLWSVYHEENATTPTRSAGRFQAPTWSWASVDREIRASYAWRGNEADILANVEEVNITTPGDPFGEVKPGGSLKIRGTLYKAQLAYKHLYGNTYAEIRKGFFAGTAYYSVFSTPYSGKARGSFVTLPDEPYIEGHTAKEREVWLLPVLKSRYINSWLNSKTEEWLVLLMLEATEEQDKYIRCGLVELKGQGAHRALEISWAEARSKDAPRNASIRIM